MTYMVSMKKCNNRHSTGEFGNRLLLFHRGERSLTIPATAVVAVKEKKGETKGGNPKGTQKPKNPKKGKEEPKKEPQKGTPKKGNPKPGETKREQRGTQREPQPQASHRENKERRSTHTHYGKISAFC